MLGGVRASSRQDRRKGIGWLVAELKFVGTCKASVLLGGRTSEAGSMRWAQAAKRLVVSITATTFMLSIAFDLL